MAGLFISFEGIDGAGKSGQIDTVRAAFEAHGHSVIRTREPGGTALAERLRAVLLAEAMDPLTEVLLLFAARRDHLRQVIEPALARGDVVLCDRFTDATFAYQGAGRGFDTTVLETLEGWVQHMPAGPKETIRRPDLTFWFDLAAELAAERLARTRAADRFESEPLDFFRRVAAGYAARMAADPARFARIDAAQARHDVWHQMARTLVHRGWLPEQALPQSGSAP